MRVLSLLASTGGSSGFNPDAEASFFSRIVADDLNALSDGDTIYNTDDIPTAGPGWPARVGANFASSLWAFTTRPILKKSIMGSHSVVRFNGVASQNTMRAAQATTTTNLLAFVCGLKRGSSNGSGFLTIHKNADADDYDNVAESEFYEGTGGIEFITPFRGGQKSKAIHPGVGFPFVYCAKFDGTNNISYLGDWPSAAAASSGAFASDWVGLGAVHQSGGYVNNSQIDMAEMGLLAPSGGSLETVRAGYLAYLTSRYSAPNPRILLVSGNSLSAPGHWVETEAANSIGAFYVENRAVGGNDLDEMQTDMTALDAAGFTVYGRMASRVDPSLTVGFVWEGPNTINLPNTARQTADKTWVICDAIIATGAKCIVVADPHNASSSPDCSAYAALVASEYASHGCILLDLRDAALQADINGNGGLHQTGVGDARIVTLADPVIRAAFDL